MCLFPTQYDEIEARTLKWFPAIEYCRKK